MVFAFIVCRSFEIFGRKENIFQDFPGGAVINNPPAIAGDTGSILCRERARMPRSK